MLEVADGALHAKAVVVVVEKCEDREAQRNEGLRCRRFNAGDKADDEADEIIQQDEKTDAGDKGLEAHVVVADDLLGQVADTFVDHLGDLLRRFGFFHRERKTHDKEECDEETGDQKLERERAVDGGRCLVGVRGAETNELVELDLDATEEEVDEMRQCKSLHDRNLDLPFQGAKKAR